MKKSEIWILIEDELMQRISDIQQSIDLIVQSKTKETKSSAGDKFETGRAMLQNEEDKLLGQLTRNKEDLLRLQVLKKQVYSSKQVQSGSLVKSGQRWFLLGLGLGKILVDDQEVFAISLQAPIAQTLLGKSKGDSFKLRERVLNIEDIY